MSRLPHRARARAFDTRVKVVAPDLMVKCLINDLERQERFDLLLGETFTKSLRSKNVSLGNRLTESSEGRPGVLRNAGQCFGAGHSADKIHKSILSRLLIDTAECSDYWFEVFAHVFCFSPPLLADLPTQ